MGNVLSFFFPKPAPASIEQVVEVSEDVAKTMEATQDLNETEAADIGLTDDSNPEDLVVCSINEGSIEAQEATNKALKASEIVIENTMAEVETIGPIPDIPTISEPIWVAPLSNIETSPEPVVLGTIEENKSQNDKEDISGGVDGLMDVLQSSTPEHPNAPTPEPIPTPDPEDYTPEPLKSSTQSPEPTPIPESIRVSTPAPVKTPTPEPEVEVISTIEEHKAQNDKEDISGGVEGLRDVLQAASSESPKSPRSEPTPTPGPKVSSPEPLKSPTPEPLKVPTPEPLLIPESIKVSTPEPVKSPAPEPPKTPTPELTPIPESINVSTPELEVEVIGTIKENKAQDEEEDMSGGVEGLRDVLQAVTSEAAASTLKAPSHEPINISASEIKNVPSPESILAIATNYKEEISGGAAGLRVALQVSKDLNEE